MNIQQATKQMIFIEPFYGHFSLGVDKKFSNQISTACVYVDGLNHKMLINEDFWNKLPDPHKIGILMHELMHISLFHLIYMKNYDDKELWNVACDMALNQYIPKENLPSIAILPSSFPELNLPPKLGAREYYKLLKQQKGNSPKLQALCQAMKGGQPTVCSHELWGDAEDLPDHVVETIKKQVEHQLKEVFENNLNKNAGSVPGHLSQIIKDIYAQTRLEISWKAIIRQFKSFCDKQEVRFTNNRPNKRYEDQKALFLRNKKSLLVAIDTSGSISDNDLKMFLEEISYMAKTGISIDLIECDTQIHSVKTIDSFSIKNKGVKISGRGGTNYGPVLKFLNENTKYNACVFLTDGYPFDKQDKRAKPILWVITPNGSVDFPFSGKKIRMNG